MLNWKLMRRGGKARPVCLEKPMKAVPARLKKPPSKLEKPLRAVDAPV